MFKNIAFFLWGFGQIFQKLCFIVRWCYGKNRGGFLACRFCLMSSFVCNICLRDFISYTSVDKWQTWTKISSRTFYINYFSHYIEEEMRHMVPQTSSCVLLNSFTLDCSLRCIVVEPFLLFCCLLIGRVLALRGFFSSCHFLVWHALHIASQPAHVVGCGQHHFLKKTKNRGSFKVGGHTMRKRA